MKTPLRSLCLQYCHDPMVCSRCSGSCQWEMYLNGKRKRFIQNRMYPWKNKVLILMDFTFITYLYNLAFSKHLPTYSLTGLFCAIQFLSYILIPKHEISSHKYILNVIINISLHHLLVSKHAQQTRLCFKNSNKKQEALRNCLAI